MGRVLIKFRDNSVESLKCKSRKRAEEVAGKRRNVKEWNYYNDGERIPKPKKNVIEDIAYDEKYFEKIMRQEGLI